MAAAREDTPLGGVHRTFLIADIRGYSTFTRERGDLTAARLATRFADLARDSVEARGGTVIELRGDEALAVFEVSDQAVRAALEFQDACREAGEADPDLPLPVGIGVATGDAVPVEDGFRGAALNLAARLCSKAVAGQVLVSAEAAEEAGRAGDLAFDSVGTAELKGFARPVELLAARSTRPAGVIAPATTAAGSVPPELDDPTPMAGRAREMRWLRGTWRQVRRGHGRVVFLSGPAGIGTTRLAGELAAFVLAEVGALRSAAPGGAGGAEALAVVEAAASATTPTLCVLDGLDHHPEAVTRLSDVAPSVGTRPVMVLAVFREARPGGVLHDLVEWEDVRGDAHWTLAPLGLEDVVAVARSTVGDPDELPAEAILRESGGVPARVHEAIDRWARTEATRRLAAAAEWMAEGRTRQSAGLDFAGTLIARNLGRIDRSRLEAGAASPDVCPYRGLAPFGAVDAPYFFGRERLVGEVAARTVAAGLLAVVGPSGSGKSSLVMAGLLPSLATGLLPGSDRWGHVILRPGDHPIDSLETALLTSAPGTRLVLVVDQFEEVFTTIPDVEEQAAFIGRLVDLAGAPEGSIVVLTIRADYVGHCAPHPDLARLIASNLVLVGPMTPDETRRAIELPARHAGLRVESALTDALVEEVGEEPGALPLLSTALVELWTARDGGWLRLQERKATGGIHGAVARLAEATYEAMSPAEREAARTVLLRLVGEGDGASPVRRRVSMSEFDVDRDETLAAVLGRLTDDRLLTRDDGMIEIAHEALIREWPRLRDWLADDAEGRRLRLHLAQAARQWDERGRDPGDLYRGARLSATLDWSRGRERELNELEREFLASGRQASERDAERQRRTNRRLRGLLVGTAIFLTLAMVAGAIALVQRGHARTAQATAESEALTSDAERIGTLARTEPELDRSFLFAVAGVRLRDLPETRGDLLSVLQANSAAYRFLHASNNAIEMAVSPDGRLLAVGDTAGVVRFVDLHTWKPTGESVRLGGPVSQNAMAFAPDGERLAVGTTTGGNRTHVFEVDVAAGTSRELGSWPSIPAFVGPVRFTRLAYSPDGTLLAVAVATASTPSPVPTSQRLLLVDTSNARVVWARDVPDNGVQNESQVEFTPSGTIVTSAQQGDTLLWNADDGSILRTFAGVGGPFAVSADGALAAIATNNDNPVDMSSSLTTLDLRTGKRTQLSAVPAKAWVVAVAFTPDGLGVAGRATDGALRVWDLAATTISQTFTEQTAGMNVAAVPGTDTLLSGDASGTVAAWDVGGADRLGVAFRWHDPSAGCGFTPCIVIDHSGRLMAESMAKGVVALVDLHVHRRVASLPAEQGPEADALAFSPDGRTLVVGGTDGTVNLWDVASRRATRTIPFGDPVFWVAVSPDGRLLAAQTKAPGSSASSVTVQPIAGGSAEFTARVQDGKGGLLFSPDGRSLAALGCCDPGSTVKVWDTGTWKERYPVALEGHATSIAFAPTGGLMAIGTEDGRVQLLNARTGANAGPPIQVATGVVDPVSFSPDGRMFVVSSLDQTASLWDVASRKRIGDSFPLEEGAVPAAAFAPDGDVVIEYLVDTVVWPTDVRRWEAFACQVAGRDLTADEWRDVLPDRRPRSVC